VLLLGLTQVVGYGTVYYSLAILSGDIAKEFQISLAQFFGCFSISLVAGGMVAPFAGRAFDRFGAAPLMVIGSVLMAITLVATALATDVVWFILAMIIMQIVSSIALYDASFTLLVQMSPQDGSRRIAFLTMIAGFASSVFWPLTTYLDASFGWRNCLLLFATMNLLLCAPIHLVLSRWSKSLRNAAEKPVALSVKGSLHPKDFGKVTALMTVGFVLSSIALSAVLAQMVPVLQSLQYGAASLWVATLFGPAQVIVRFTNLFFGSKRHPMTITLLATSLLPLGLIAVAYFPPLVAGAIIGVILIGMSSGLKSIVQGTLPLALFGSEGYGAKLGFMASFRYVAAALSPFAYAGVAQLFGAAIACLFFACVAIASVACFVYLKHIIGSTSEKELR
jgi:MFS family permease